MARFNRYIRKITSDFWRDRFKPADLLRVFSHIQSILGARLDEYLLGEYDLLDLDIHTVGHTRVWVPTHFIFDHKIEDENEYYPYVYKIEEFWLDVDAIYNHHVDPDLSLQNNIDFVYDGNGTIRFVNELPDQLKTPLYISKGHWAGYRIQKAIGDLLGYRRIDSTFYRDSIAVVLNPFFNGPTYDALLALWNIILGIPVTKYGSEVVTVVTDHTVTTDKYFYDLGSATPTVAKGDILKRFQVLTNAVEIITHKTDPYWWKDRPPEIFQKYFVPYQEAPKDILSEFTNSGGEIYDLNITNEVTKESRDYIMETFLFDVVLSIKINGQYVDIANMTDNIDLVYLFYEALPTRSDPILSQSYGLVSIDQILDNGFIMDTPDKKDDTTPDGGGGGHIIHRGEGNGTGTGNIEDVEDPDDPVLQESVITGILNPKYDNFKTRLHINSVYGIISENRVAVDQYIHSPKLGRPWIPKDTVDDGDVESDSLALKLNDYHWHIFDRDQDFNDDFTVKTYELPKNFVLDETYKSIPWSNFFEFWREKPEDYSFVEPTYSKVFIVQTDNPSSRRQKFVVNKNKFTGKVDEHGLAIMTNTGDPLDNIDSQAITSFKSSANTVDRFGHSYSYTGSLNTYNIGYAYLPPGVKKVNGSDKEESSFDSESVLTSDLSADSSMSINDSGMTVSKDGDTPQASPISTEGFHDCGITTSMIQSHYKFGLGVMLWWDSKSDNLTYTMDGITLVGDARGYLITPEIFLGRRPKDISWDLSLRLQEGSDIEMYYSTTGNSANDSWIKIELDPEDGVVEEESTVLNDSHNLFWKGRINDVSNKIWFKYVLVPNGYNVPILSSIGLTIHLK